jgi:murein DD-endopeptidase MepM/ murein hydrolase activator NlpD
MFYPVREVQILGGVKYGKGNVFGWVRKKGTKAHQGWDFAARDNTPLYAVADGTIEYVDKVDDSNYGKQILMSFSGSYGETFYAFYAHINSNLVERYDTVKAGDLIGYSGSTGNAKGSNKWEQHLHFEFRSERHCGKGLEGRIDPQFFFGPPPFAWMCGGEFIPYYELAGGYATAAASGY